MLRNSGNDFNNTQMRDDAMQAMVQGIDVDGQAATPVAVYLNGEYMGVMSIKERIDEDWVQAHYGINSDSVNVLDAGGNALVGSSNDFSEITNWLNSNSLSVAENYTTIKGKMDIDEYINYMISEIYFANTDWPGNNTKIWKPQNGGKWRWALYDTDFGFGLSGQATDNTLTFALEPNGPGWPNPPWSTFLFRKMMESDEFRSEFIQRATTYCNTIFKPERFHIVIEFVFQYLIIYIHF